MAINPKWQKKKDHRLLIGGTGDWECLVKSGQNVMLSPLAALGAWRETNKELEDWSVAMNDVTWVVGELLTFVSRTPRLPVVPSKLSNTTAKKTAEEKHTKNAPRKKRACDEEPKAERRITRSRR